MPIIKSLSENAGSLPGETSKKLGSFLVFTVLQVRICMYCNNVEFFLPFQYFRHNLKGNCANHRDEREARHLSRFYRAAGADVPVLQQWVSSFLFVSFRFSTFVIVYTKLRHSLRQARIGAVLSRSLYRKLLPCCMLCASVGCLVPMQTLALQVAEHLVLSAFGRCRLMLSSGCMKGSPQQLQ